MITLQKIPTRDEAFRLMKIAETRNPGPWVQHSLHAARAAEIIASHHPMLDPSTAYILGYLHDIGRQEGVTDMRHTLDGYVILSQLGYSDAAQVCLTHSFPEGNIRSGAQQWDCTQEEFIFAQDRLASVEITEYDRLIQLCDSITLPTGFCLLEKRFVDVTLRHGFNDYTIDKWKAFIRIKEEFETIIQASIYSFLPGVVENTFRSTQTP